MSSHHAHNERQIDFALYRLPPDDEDGLTPLQVMERRQSTRRVSMIRYDTAMTTEQAKVVINTATDVLMYQLGLDAEQAADLKYLARRHMARLEMAEIE